MKPNQLLAVLLFLSCNTMLSMHKSLSAPKDFNPVEPTEYTLRKSVSENMVDQLLKPGSKLTIKSASGTNLTGNNQETIRELFLKRSGKAKLRRNSMEDIFDSLQCLRAKFKPDELNGFTKSTITPKHIPVVIQVEQNPRSDVTLFKVPLQITPTRAVLRIFVNSQRDKEAVNKDPLSQNSQRLHLACVAVLLKQHLFECVERNAIVDKKNSRYAKIHGTSQQ